MVTLPSGNITYLFTDIEGSTRLWEQQPGSMRAALARHDEITVSTVERHGGSGVRSRGQGDSFFGVFPNAKDAVAAACEIQLALHSERWPTTTPIRVRIALHTGESELRGNDYYGSVVNRCARLRGIANGGQTLLSAVTAGLVADSLAEGVELRPLGSHWLRDLRRPEDVYQLVHPGLPSDFPPLESIEEQQDVTPFQMTDFVGRERELGQLRYELGEAMSGKGRLVVLVGEPGIGKTRTATEIASIAEKRGALVWWGRCHEDEGAPPYWPWVQPLRAYVQSIEANRLSLELGSGASYIAQVIPEIHEKLPDLEALPNLEPEQARFRLFDSVTTFLTNLSQGNPLILILDDLQWADGSSLQLLAFFAQQMADSHVLVVGTYRDIEVSTRHPLSDTLARLSREPVFHRVTLGGLSKEDSGSFVEAATGTNPSESLLTSIYTSAEGNPFFMAEIVRLLGERDELGSSEAAGPYSISIPEGVREVIGQRLNRLSEQCQNALTIASVIGREFDFRLLSAVSRDDESELLDAIDESLEAHLIEEKPDEFERYQFSHALIQQTLVERLSGSRRVRLHASIAQALEKSFEDDLQEHASELAFHYLQAERITGKDNLIHYSLLAGEQALASYAWEEALAHFEMGLSAKEGQPMDDEKAELTFGLARAQTSEFDRGKTIQALETAIPAFDYYVETGNVSKALAIAEHPFQVAFGYVVSGELAGKAAKLAPKGSVQQGYFLSAHGLSVYHQKGDSEGAKKLLDEAMEIAQKEGDVNLELRVLNDLGRFHEAEQNFSESLAVGLQVIDLSNRTGLPLEEASPHTRAVNSYVALGDLDSARHHAAALLNHIGNSPGNSSVAYAAFMNHLVARLSGAWQKARYFSDQGLAISPRDCRHLYSRTLMEYQLGNFSEGQDYLERLLDVMRSSSPGPTLEYSLAAAAIVATSLITGDTGRFDILDSIIEILSVPRAVAHPYWYSQIVLGFAAIQTGNFDQASTQYTRLKQYPYPMQGWGIMDSNRLLGLLSSTSGDLDTSAAHFEGGLVTCRKGGYRPELAWICYDYANCLLDRNNPGDRDKAVSLMEEALSISTELDMKPLIERTSALKERIGATDSSRSAPKYPKGLTEREVEVLTLAAQGKTNQEIAEELFISVRTVQNHIRNIYDKIDARNRAEATAFAINYLGTPE